ncbi:hypothetical protein JTB14_016642 [Gonioctena quinquepunctata]|nr:hypothetical protein JTB14_016642 [Gonioctena quinquepunctata]
MGFDELATINVKVGSYFLRHNMYSSDNIFAGTLTQLFASLSGTIFAISDGMVYGWTAPMIPYTHQQPQSPQHYQIRSGMVRNGDNVRIPLICWINALADRMLYIHIARVFSGTTSNMSFVAAPMYIAEIAVSKIRGFLSSIIYLMMLLGFVVVYSVGPFCPFYVIPIIGGVVPNLKNIIVFLHAETLLRYSKQTRASQGHWSFPTWPG